MRPWSDRWFEFQAHIRHQLIARGPHGIHSPFIFDLITHYSKTAPDARLQESIRQIHRRIFRDDRWIEKIDLGTGSSGKQKINRIAQHSSQPFKHSIFLAWLAKHFGCKHILELGTNLGLTAAALAKINPTAEIISIEGCPQTAEIARQHLIKSGIENVKVICSDAGNYLRSHADQLSRFNFVFIDCNHTYSATTEYFKYFQSSKNSDLTLVIDDIHWSRNMNQAWNSMIESNAFEVSMDFLHLGILKRRCGKEKEHFVLKIPG